MFSQAFEAHYEAVSFCKCRNQGLGEWLPKTQLVAGCAQIPKPSSRCRYEAWRHRRCQAAAPRAADVGWAGSGAAGGSPRSAPRELVFAPPRPRSSEPELGARRQSAPPLRPVPPVSAAPLLLPWRGWARREVGAAGEYRLVTAGSVRAWVGRRRREMGYRPLRSLLLAPAALWRRRRWTRSPRAVRKEERQLQPRELRPPRRSGNRLRR